MSEALRKAKLKLLDTHKEPPKEEKVGKKSKHNQEYLWKAIETASNCTSILPEEEERVMRLVDELIANQAEDEHWETRVKYHLHNLEIMKATYPVFEEEAKRRKDLIDSVNRRNKWLEEKEKCRLDTQYWFDNYSWTADPRKTGIWALPFMLYDFQKDAVAWIESQIFLKRASGLVEKSRDLGLSWIFASQFYKYWQHSKDGSFHALIGSITADECDTVGDPSSIFEKIRIQARLQPLGLLPRGWNCDVPYMKIVNPEDGSTITGSTSNADFGRSGRYTVILFDEFSAFEQDTAAMTASSQSSPCKMYNSTARGMGNEYYRLAHSGTVDKKTYHWTVHPQKDERWYEYQKLEMSPTQVAQELDINYDASQPNKVYGDYNEVYHVVTKSEVMKALPQFKNMGGEFHIPFGHSLAFGEDVGQTEEHAHVMLWYCTLREGTRTVDGQDLSGCVFIYRERIMPPKSPPRIWAETIKREEGLYESRMMNGGRWISQEAVTEAEIYWDEYKLSFENWSPDYVIGIARVKEYLDIKKTKFPHPFRDATRKEKYPDGEPIMGRPSIFIIVDDEQGSLLYNRELKKYTVSPAKDSNGFIRTRGEFPAYHYPKSELGKAVAKMRPKKNFDDSMDNVRCVATECFAPLNKKSVDEQLEDYLPQHLKTDNIHSIPVEELGMAFMQRNEHVRQFREQQRNTYIPYKDRLIQDAFKKTR